MQTYHALAECRQCGVLYDGPSLSLADAAANRHTTSKAQGHTKHPSSTRAHPTGLCGPHCERSAS